MNDNFQVYNESVLDFVRSAQAFCDLVTQTTSVKRSLLAKKLHQLLPLLYFQSLKLPEVEPFYEEGNEKFVTEEEYNQVKDGLLQVLGYLDDYVEVEESESAESDSGIIVSSLSGNLADIYQDLGDFLKLYQIGTTELMNDALWECRLNFERYWGKKVLSVLRAFHEALYGPEPIDDDKPSDPLPDSRPDTSEWFISRRQREY